MLAILNVAYHGNMGKKSGRASPSVQSNEDASPSSSESYLQTQDPSNCVKNTVLCTAMQARPVETAFHAQQRGDTTPRPRSAAHPEAGAPIRYCPMPL